MRKYHAIYKCMLCGELMHGAIIDIANAENPQQEASDSMKMLKPTTVQHICSNGNIGLMTFAGLEREGSDMIEECCWNCMHRERVSDLWQEHKCLKHEKDVEPWEKCDDWKQMRRSVPDGEIRQGDGTE